MATLQSDLNGAPAFDIAVIGAGPAGLAAAVTAAGGGARVILIDAEPVVGGQFWRHPAVVPGPDRLHDGEVASLHHRLREYRSWRRSLVAHQAAGRITHLARHEVWAVERAAPDCFSVHAVTGDAGARREVSVTAAKVILAPGAYDLQIPFPGWDVPGVMTAGGVQSLLKGHAVLASRRVVVAGTGPFLLSVAAGLLHHGAEVVAVIEAATPTAWLRHPRAVVAAGSKIVEGAGYAAALLRHRVRYLTGWTVVRADGDQELESVTVAPWGTDGRPALERARQFDAGVLAVGWGFVAQCELALALGCATTADVSGLPVVAVDAAQRSSVPGVYVAGEACGVGGAELATVEGEIAGRAAALAIGSATGLDVRLPSRLARRRRALRTFAAALARVYPVPEAWPATLPDESLVCRCEEVDAGAIREIARRDGAGDARTAKLLVRAGMGVCQGRICGFATECVAAHAAGRRPEHRPVERPVAAPIPLGVVGGPPTL